MQKTFRKRTRHELLIEAAAGLFVRWGYDKTSVDDIAREAGVAKGSVYLEFANKEALFKAVVYRELGRYLEDWLSRLDQEPGKWSFARMFQHSLAAIDANPFVKALITRDQSIYGSFLRRDTELLALMISMRAQFFQRLQTAGVMRDDIPAAVIASLVSEISYGMIAGEGMIPPGQRVSFEQSARALGLLLDRGLAPEKPRGAEEAREFLREMVEKLRDSLASAQAGHRGHSERKPSHRSPRT